MTNEISAAATAVLIRSGLEHWSTAEVAREAGCAKGLVHYYHRTKNSLLARVAAGLGETRARRRIEAFRPEGAAALDALWAVLLAEARSGELAAWLGLLALNDPAIRRATAPAPAALTELAAALNRCLGVAEYTEDQAAMAFAALDGFQVALLQGASPETIRQSYHRFWLGLLP